MHRMRAGLLPSTSIRLFLVFAKGKQRGSTTGDALTSLDRVLDPTPRSVHGHADVHLRGRLTVEVLTRYRSPVFFSKKEEDSRGSQVNSIQISLASFICDFGRPAAKPFISQGPAPFRCSLPSIYSTIPQVLDLLQIHSLQQFTSITSHTIRNGHLRWRSQYPGEQSDCSKHITQGTAVRLLEDYHRSVLRQAHSWYRCIWNGLYGSYAR